MVIRKVSSTREPPMLSTVRTLRRLLRNAFLVTNLVRVISFPNERMNNRAISAGLPALPSGYSISHLERDDKSRASRFWQSSAVPLPPALHYRRHLFSR